MADKSLKKQPSAKKPGRSIKEKRAAKALKQEAPGFTPRPATSKS